MRFQKLIFSLFILASFSAAHGTPTANSKALHLRSNNYARCPDIDIEISGQSERRKFPEVIELQNKNFRYAQYDEAEDTYSLTYRSTEGESLSLVYRGSALLYNNCLYDYENAIPSHR